MPKSDKTKKNSQKGTKPAKREIVYKVDGSVYGQATKLLGDCNFMVYCFDGKDRLCHIRRKIKRDKVAVDSIVMVGTRDYQDNKGDIIYVYTREEAAVLRSEKEIPDNVNIGNGIDVASDDDDDTGFNFAEI